MTDNKVEIKDKTFYYTEYGYRGLEEIQRLREENAKLKAEIESLKQQRNSVVR